MRKTRLNSISPLKIKLDNFFKIDKLSLQKNFFYRHSKLVAPDLIGCYLIRNSLDRNLLTGIIVETEAYSQEEEACHGFNKKNISNNALFGEPGIFYVYKSYGIHHCLNVVTDKKNFASGVLIRSVYLSDANERLASGPGLVTRTYGINLEFNYLKILENNSLTIMKGEKKFRRKDLVQTSRVGISKAKNLKWRWYLKNSRSISKREKGDRKPLLKSINNHLSIHS